MKYLFLLLPFLFYGTCSQYVVVEEEVSIDDEEQREYIVTKRPTCEIGKVRETRHYRYQVVRCEPE